MHTCFYSPPSRLTGLHTILVLVADRAHLHQSVKGQLIDPKCGEAHSGKWPPVEPIRRLHASTKERYSEDRPHLEQHRWNCCVGGSTQFRLQRGEKYSGGANQ